MKSHIEIAIFLLFLTVSHSLTADVIKSGNKAGNACQNCTIAAKDLHEKYKAECKDYIRPTEKLINYDPHYLAALDALMKYGNSSSVYKSIIDTVKCPDGSQ